MVEFTIDIRDLQGIPQAALVTVQGSIDFYTAGSFREEIETARAQGVRRIVLDLEQVTYVNSSGLSIIIAFAGEGSSESPSLVLLKVPPKIKIVFDMLRLDPLLKYCPTLEEAVQVLKGKGASQASVA